MLALFPGDSALLLLVLVLGGFIGFGMVADGIRMALLLVASVISYFVAPLLGGYVPRGLLPKNPIWREAGVGDIHAFMILMVLLFIGIHFLHRWITIEVKYKLPARKHNDWARVNSVLGLCVGGITGVLYYLVLAGLGMPPWRPFASGAVLLWEPGALRRGPLAGTSGDRECPRHHDTAQLHGCSPGDVSAAGAAA